MRAPTGTKTSTRVAHTSTVPLATSIPNDPRAAVEAARTGGQRIHARHRAAAAPVHARGSNRLNRVEQLRRNDRLVSSRADFFFVDIGMPDHDAGVDAVREDLPDATFGERPPQLRAM